MRIAIAPSGLLVGLLCLTAYAEEVHFDGGQLSVIWSTDEQYMTIQLMSNVPLSEAESRVWILTIYSHRFDDGVSNADRSAQLPRSFTLGPVSVFFFRKAR